MSHFIMKTATASSQADSQEISLNSNYIKGSTFLGEDRLLMAQRQRGNVIGSAGGHQVERGWIQQRTGYAWGQHEAFGEWFIRKEYHHISLRRVTDFVNCRLQRLFRLQLLRQQLTRFIY